jgi:hypothetical protein
LHAIVTGLGVLDARTRLHKQMPGQMFPCQTDDLKGLRRDIEAGRSAVAVVREEDFVRFQVASELTRRIIDGAAPTSIPF